MTWDVPWVISGVDEIPVELARVLAYAATAGREGIIDSDDLKVAALGTPGGAVTVGSGAFVAVNRFTANSSESYIGRNSGSVTVSVSNTSGSPRSDLIYAHITDPGQPGQPVDAAPVDVRVVTNVAADVTSISQVPALANQSGYALARIDRPGSSTTVTNAHIVDLRQMALVYSSKEVRSSVLNYSPSTWGAELTRNSASWSAFPSEAKYQAAIPLWANRAQVVLNVGGLGTKSTPTSGASIAFLSRLTMSSVAPSGSGGTQASTSSFNHTAFAYGTGGNDKDSNAYRASIGLAAEIVIPSALRGTTAWFYVESQQPASPNGGLWTISGTNIQLDVTFTAKPE